MNEIDKAREAATVQCDHEWPGSHLIPRCGKCGHTEATILYLNQGIRQGFDAGLATATAKIERLRGLLADAMESSLGMTQGAIGRVQSFQDAEAFLTTLEPKDGEL